MISQRRPFHTPLCSLLPYAWPCLRVVGYEAHELSVRQLRSARCAREQSQEHPARHSPSADHRLQRRLHHSLFQETGPTSGAFSARSEEHTSELQSPCNLVCRLLLEKKKKKKNKETILNTVKR